MASVNSMTAFGRATSNSELSTIECELKTLNNRYLEINLKLPDNLKKYESTLRNIVKNALERGKLEANIRLRNTQESALIVDDTAVAAISDAINNVRKVNPEIAAPSGLDILKMPGVLKEQSDTQLEPLLIATFEQAIADLQQARQREGEALKQLLDDRVAQIRAKTTEIVPKVPELQQKQHGKLLKRISELNVDVDKQRLEQELVILVNKSDVAEELDRLHMHCDEIERVLQQGGACGRRLDFMMQELNREANTLGSKAVGTEMTQTAVDIKVLIEQMREQIQNLE